MSSPTPTDTKFSFRKTLKGFVKVPQPSVLIPVLQVVVQASSAFTPLQSAAGGLLKVIEIVEVCFSPQSSSISVADDICWIESSSEYRGYRQIDDIFLQSRYRAPGPAEKC